MSKYKQIKSIRIKKIGINIHDRFWRIVTSPNLLIGLKRIGVLKGRVITFVELTDSKFHLGIAAHGEPRKPTFTEGKIGSRLILCEEYAVLHV
ncbi:hypothetical protein B9G55_19525 [Saccharibacillus sp. O16]|nr:hypothetical protein B9G55_19525 [Saccharibacillus sp. O16]